MTDELVERIADAMMTEANRPENLLRCLDSYESWVLARACLSAIEAEGLVIVPREPTESMVHFGGGVTSKAYRAEAWCDPEDVWSAMLAAAPKPK